MTEPEHILTPDEASAYRALRSRMRGRQEGIEVWCNARGKHRPMWLRRLGTDGFGVTDFGALPTFSAEDAQRFDDEPSHFEHRLGDHWGYVFTCSGCILEERVKGERLVAALVAAIAEGKTRIFVHELLR